MKYIRRKGLAEPRPTHKDDHIGAFAMLLLRARRCWPCSDLMPCMVVASDLEVSGVVLIQQTALTALASIDRWRLSCSPSGNAPTTDDRQQIDTAWLLSS